MLPDTIAKGGFAESLVAARALEKGYVPSKPMVDARYDLIIDDGIRRNRVQIKYCNREHLNASGAVAVGLKKKNDLLYRANEIDALVVYIEPIKQLCWLPVELVAGKTSIAIRYQPTKNGQSKNCIMAEDYTW